METCKRLPNLMLYTGKFDHFFIEQVPDVLVPAGRVVSHGLYDRMNTSCGRNLEFYQTFAEITLIQNVFNKSFLNDI